ncbi:NADPH-dependent 7-cyano-7-deazaguanine reductase QueF [Thalassotalea fusca]
MSNYSNASILESLTLGKSTEYKSTYSPDLLQGVPRSLNRDQIDIQSDSLPFLGEDVWYGYEVSWLNNKGKPIVAVAEFRFPCTSANIVESKSFKLYLNSFNQSKFENIDAVQTIMSRDLSQIAGQQSQVSLHPVDKFDAIETRQLPGECIDDIDVSIEHYDLKPELLKCTESNDIIDEVLHSHLLKSNCLITNQPDWASVVIEYQGRAIDKASLLKYLISFRQHNEFHEQCVERIFADIMKICAPTKLTVYARYTRRGGLDINPFRSTHLDELPNFRTHRQ